MATSAAGAEHQDWGLKLADGRQAHGALDANLGMFELQLWQHMGD